MRNEESYGANKKMFTLLSNALQLLFSNFNLLPFCFLPNGVLRLQTEEEALCKCFDIVNAMEMILRHVHCQVACIK